jgi:hypothetical protein
VSNPTGSTYLSANQNYVWADGDVYLIPQTDQVEGAAAGASFGGLGVANQPHQKLLDKLNYLHAHQLTDESNIAALQALVGLISSDVGPNGWIKTGAIDTVLGTIQFIMQWGFVDNFGVYTDAQPAQGQQPQRVPVTFTIAFPNAVWTFIPYWQTSDNAGRLIASVYDPTGLQPTGIFSLRPITPLSRTSNLIAW